VYDVPHLFIVFVASESRAKKRRWLLLLENIARMRLLSKRDFSVLDLSDATVAVTAIAIAGILFFYLHRVFLS